MVILFIASTHLSNSDRVKCVVWEQTDRRFVLACAWLSLWECVHTSLCKNLNDNLSSFPIYRINSSISYLGCVYLWLLACLSEFTKKSGEKERSSAVSYLFWEWIWVQSWWWYVKALSAALGSIICWLALAHSQWNAFDVEDFRYGRRSVIPG